MSVAEQMVSVPDTSTLFMARRSDLRLIKKAVRQTRDVEGNVAETILGQTIGFHDNVLRIPATGGVRMEDGRECPAHEILEWLEGHPLKEDIQEGFWRVDPTAPPPSEPELELLQALAMDLDVLGLEGFINQERAGWARRSLLEVAERSLERAREKLSESEALRQEALNQARREGEAHAEGEARKGKAG